MILSINKKVLFRKSIRPFSSIWFPKNKKDLDKIANNTLEAGKDIDADHPGFNDINYRKRRQFLANYAINHRHDKIMPFLEYTKDEINTWKVVLNNLEPLLKRFACNKYLTIWPEIKKECGYEDNNIPQISDINNFLNKKTNFNIRPCAGLLTSRDFLNALAHRTFFSTQYIRHHSVPLYTPEPDICHEFIGHVPMFADKNFADLSQDIGIASLGASDETINKLAKCYWYSIEFGLTKENGHLKAYGAGLLSSFGELEYACAPYRPAGGENDFPIYKEWDFNKVCGNEYPITKYQPKYFVINNFEDVRKNINIIVNDLS